LTIRIFRPSGRSFLRKWRFLGRRANNNLLSVWIRMCWLGSKRLAVVIRRVSTVSSGQLWKVSRSDDLGRRRYRKSVLDHDTGERFARVTALTYTSGIGIWLSSEIENRRTLATYFVSMCAVLTGPITPSLWDEADIEPIPGNKLPGYYDPVPPGQKSLRLSYQSPITSHPSTRLMLAQGGPFTVPS